MRMEKTEKKTSIAAENLQVHAAAPVIVYAALVMIPTR